MADSDDVIRFAEEDGPAPRPDKTWKVAIIDDDPAVHEGTRYALSDYRLMNQGIELLSAFSAKEGRALMQANPDIAVVLLDVVMESDSAGLDLVTVIRKQLKNDMVRIILRTGQPGQAPERSIIIDYDINDYKAKTELTADRLFTAITAALRSYQQLQKMAETRRGLEIIVDAASTLFDFKSMQKLAEGVLTQLTSLLAADCMGMLVLRDENQQPQGFSILAASGCYAKSVTPAAPGGLDETVRALIQRAFQRRLTEFSDDKSAVYINTSGGSEVIVILQVKKTLSETDRALVEIFCGRLSTAFDNVVLYEQLQNANSSLERRVAQRTRELTMANARLQAQWLRARRANAFQSEVLGMVAHDIRNPLGVILGRTEIVNELLAKPEYKGELLSAQITHIRDSAQRLTGMVTELISSAMTDDDDISLRCEDVDIGSLAKDVVEANRPLSDRKGQIIAVKADAGLIVHCDIDRMRDAFDNLVSNAIKYSVQGGAIDVEITGEGSEVMLRVRDSGPGLLPDDKTRLFGRFQRLSAQPTGGEPSTGLGLAIAKRIVELHAGAISAESAGPGHGSTFSIKLKSANSGMAR